MKTKLLDKAKYVIGILVGQSMQYTGEKGSTDSAAFTAQLLKS